MKNYGQLCILCGRLWTWGIELGIAESIFFFSTGQSTKKLGIFWEYVLIFELLGNSQEGYESILGE